MSRKRAILTVGLVAMLCACQSPPHLRVDDLAVLPEGAMAKSDYARFYALIELKSELDLPFTTSHTFTLAAPRKVWVSVFTEDVELAANIPSVPWPPSGATRIEAMEDFPQIFHGGCRVVNLVADFETGETLASWCNVDDRPSALPSKVPYYYAENSPLREN
ncbi:hypothetical protein OB03_12635 [Brevundimonas sp. GN22]